jgi:integrase
MRPVTVLRPGSLTETMTELSDWVDLVHFVIWMEAAKLSVRTIGDRLSILRRLQRSLPDGDITHATRTDLETFQASYRHLQVASVNVYTRHVKAFYRWLLERGTITVDPSVALPVPVVHRGQPHPASVEQVRTIFACTTGGLRLAYALAAFAGLRCGEITRLQSNAIDLTSRVPTAVIHGKGGRERTVPILPPLAYELGHVARYAETGDVSLRSGLSARYLPIASGPELARYRSARSIGPPPSPRAHRGWVVRREDGAPYSPKQLSLASCKHLHDIGVDTTLHSLRHSFATWVARATRDPLLVRDLLGHASVATTEIYMASAATEAQSRLGELSALAGDVLDSARLTHSA